MEAFACFFECGQTCANKQTNKQTNKQSINQSTQLCGVGGCEQTNTHVCVCACVRVCVHIHLNVVRLLGIKTGERMGRFSLYTVCVFVYLR